MYPQTLDAGNLNRKYDVLVLTDGAFRKSAGIAAGGSQYSCGIPSWLGRITEDKTVPQLKKFVAGRRIAGDHRQLHWHWRSCWVCR